jgi:hypothetical protein
MGATNRFSEAACVGATDGFSKASWGVYTDFQEALEKQFVAHMQL